MKIAFEELQKCKNKTRKARIYTTKEKIVQEDEFDKKWSESLMNLKGGYYRMYQLQSYYYKEGQVSQNEKV